MRTFAVVAAYIFTVAVGIDATIAGVFNMPAGQTSLQFVTVGNPGNEADTRVMRDGTSGRGRVGYTYQMGQFDITTGQYCAFLNAVARSDTYDLYSTSMDTRTHPAGYGCGIRRDGSPSSYTYSVEVGRENFPVNYVSWGDAARFCNWLANGQPTGSQGPGTTETGSYALCGATTATALLAVTREPLARYVIPAVDEWYKSAYYKGGSKNAGYWAYATRSDEQPSNVLSSTGTNNANFFNGMYGYTDPANHLTPVGTFASSPGPYGTFDQNGNVNQWTETLLYDSVYNHYGWCRGTSGASWNADPPFLRADWSSEFCPPTTEWDTIGFRVAMVPEPASMMLLLLSGMAALACRNGRRAT